MISRIGDVNGYHRVGCASVLSLVAALSVERASSQTALINGANQTGTLLANTTNTYTFSASTTDNINLRLGTTNFNGKLQLYGPNGALLATTQNSTDDLIAYTATNSGTFTVLVSSFSAGDTGTYVLHLAQVPEAFVVPAGDEGGPLANGGNFYGAISLAIWTCGRSAPTRVTTSICGWARPISTASSSCTGRTALCWPRLKTARTT